MERFRAIARGPAQAPRDRRIVRALALALALGVGIYGHLIVEDLRVAVEMNTQLQALTPGPENANPNAPDPKFAAFLLHSAENGDSKALRELLKVLRFQGKGQSGRSRV